MLGISSETGSRVRRAETYHNAHVIADHVAILFPTAKNLDAVDPLAAKAMAYHGIIRALMESYDIKSEKEWEFEGLTSVANLPDLIEWQDGLTEELCKIDFSGLRVPDFPIDMERVGWTGAVITGYNITPEGYVTDKRILGEVPKELFSHTVFEAMDKWKMDVDGLDPGCLKNRTFTVLFVFG